jgi:histidyl-tRNA synthetase
MPQKKVFKKTMTQKEGNAKTVVKKSLAAKKATVANVSQEEMLLQALRGMRDILPDEQPYWERVRKALAHAAQEYGFQRIDTPLVEFTHLFTRSIGTETDIVEKEMYTFTTRGGDKVSLRPEFTAGIARAFIQHGMGILPKPVKLFSIGPVYRYDRPQ